MPPAIRTRETSQGEAPRTFRAGETVVIQPNVVTPDLRAGVQMGELCAVTPAGAESLHAFPLELVRAG